MGRGRLDELLPHLPRQEPQPRRPPRPARPRAASGRGAARPPRDLARPGLSRDGHAHGRRLRPSRPLSVGSSSASGRAAGSAASTRRGGSLGVVTRPIVPRDTLGGDARGRRDALGGSRRAARAGVAPPGRHRPVQPASSASARGAATGPSRRGRASSARFVAETRAGGFELVYEELPFEWSHQRTFGVHRRMRGGPVESYTWRVHAGAAPRPPTAPGALEGGTRADPCASRSSPRCVGASRPSRGSTPAASPAKFAAARPAMIDAHVLQGDASPYVEPVSPSDARARRGGRRAGCEADDVPRRAGRPSARARRDGTRRGPRAHAPLRARRRVGRRPARPCCARSSSAVPAGLVELRWGIVCPSCMHASQQVRRARRGRSPRGTASSATSPSSSISTAPSRRRSCRTRRCARCPRRCSASAGPARTPHVLVQATVDAGASALARRARARRAASACSRAAAPRRPLEVDDAGARDASTVTLDDGSGRARRTCTSPPAARCASSTADGADARHVKIERLGFASAAATAHVVSTLPRVPHPLLERSAQARHAAQGRARRGALQRSHGLDGALLAGRRRRRVPPRRRSLRRPARGGRRARRRARQDDGRRRHGRLRRRRAAARAPPSTRSSASRRSARRTSTAPWSGSSWASTPAPATSSPRTARSTTSGRP